MLAQNNPDTTAWFNVTTSATLAHDIELSEEAFHKSIALSDGTKVQAKQELTIPYLHYYYLCALNQVGEFHRALKQLNELREIYETIHTMDDMFLYIRGVPTLTGIMGQALKTFIGLGISFDAKNWCLSFSKSLDDCGNKIIADISSKLPF